MDRFPTLYSARLILRKIQIEDVPSLVKYANNKTISDHIVNIPYPYREPDAAFRIRFVVDGFKKKTHYAFAIILNETGEMIGEVSLHFQDKHQPHAQLGYWVGEPFWNKGIATEAARAVLDFGFNQLNLDLIFADCHPTNTASESVMLKLGMVKHRTDSKLLLYKLTKEENKKGENLFI